MLPCMRIDYIPFRSEFLEPLATLISANFAADGVEYATTVEEVGEWLDGSSVTPELDYRLALDHGELVGFASVSHRLSEGDFARAMLSGGVAVSHRGQGIGTELFGWANARGEARLAEAGQDLPSQLWAFSYEQQDDKRQLFSGSGYGIERYYHEMRRPLTQEVQAVAELEGIHIEPYSAALDREIHAVEVEAFNDHWGSIPMTDELWAEFMSAASTRLDLSFIARAGDEVVGMCIGAHFPADEAVSGRREGWIDSLGTKRAWRKKGIATALMERSFVAFRNAGFSHAALGVDSTNPTGAAELYLDVGFAPVRTEVLSVKHL
jgi:mycothiol synthase